MSSQEVEHSSNILVAILTASIFIVVLLLAAVIVYSATGTAYDNYAGNVTTTVTVSNETGAWVNFTGYTLDNIAAGNTGFTLTAIYNTTDDVPIALANATTSTGGIVTNATATVWDDVYISYTYTDDVTDATTVNIGIDDIQTNILSMLGNFFVLMPTIGTILAVVILIAAIVILIMYVVKMKNQGDSSTGETQFAG